MNWTKQQSDAIYDSGGTLLVSAAAGSGKTAVLVERAVQLMLREENPIPADRILIVTFTRAAAEELRGRIGARLAAEQGLHAHNLHIRRQRFLLGRASICTIDAFCMQLLKNYFTELNIPPDFDKADDALIKALRAAAISETLEKMYEDEAFCALSSMYGKSRSDESVEEAVLKLYDFLRSAALPDAAAKNIEQMWQSPLPIAQSAWGEELFSHAQSSIESALSIAETALRLASGTGLENYIPALNSDISSLNLMLKPIIEKKWDEAYTAVRGYKAAARKGKNSGGEDLAETVKLLRDKVKKTITKLCEGVFICTESEYFADIGTAAPMVCSLIKAAKMFEEIFYAKKVNEKVLEYSDFEHLARKLLATENGEKTKAAQELSSSFDAVMIDEYQDTNALQALLYSCLANEDGSNLFMVGDVKQSIYRFRLAEPGIFVEKKDSYKPFGEGYPAVITLGHNFRSAQSVVDQINYIFTKLMSRSLGGVEYNEEERLVAGGGAGFFGEAAEIKIIDTANGRCEAADAHETAQSVEKMVKDGFTVREGTTVRPCRYGDFCVLLRTRASLLQYAAAFEAKGIPCVADTAENSLLSPEISPLLSLLRVIDNPGQDIHMAAVLLSPMYAYSPQELLKLREEGKSLYAALCCEKNERDKKTASDLRYYRAVCASAPFSQLIDEILLRTSYFSAVSAMPEGAIRRENLRAFISYACDSCTAMGGLSPFLRRIDSSEGTLPELDSAVKSTRGAVSIMTVHKSKGLEFPVCIFANTQHGFNQRNFTSKIMLSQKLGLGLALSSPQGSLYRTLALRALSLFERRECVSEEMRVLYVALTRARDKLIISMSKKDAEDFIQSIALPLMCKGAAAKLLLNEAADMSVWICAAAMLHPGCTELRQIKAGALLEVDEKEKSEFCASIIPLYKNEAEEANENKSEAQPDPKLLNDVLQSFKAAELLSAQEHVPVKTSVSSLAKKQARQTLSRPSFLYSQGLTAAEKGTAMHSVLQFIDFAAAREDLNAECSRLCEGRYVLPEIMDKLDKKALFEFLQSGVVNRLLSAKTLYREYDFLTDIKDFSVEKHSILVQGIADLVIIGDNGIEIVDYKTDKGKSSNELIRQYSQQLYLYAEAVSRRFDAQVTRLTIYSFDLNEEINVVLR